uniref:Uncharacterized protein LOC104227174 n=1 Tax=Nicotiana sylvestris TaxID=4096 RepID=A0A1U7WK24_NICSY|nr:PREDICTED: uncharacterized protein LOC104227174 [Nicotiana sylvestris]
MVVSRWEGVVGLVFPVMFAGCLVVGWTVTTRGGGELVVDCGREGVGLPAKEVPDEDDDDATKIYQKYLEECLTTKCIILISMNSELQRKHQDMDPTIIIEHLKKMFGTQSRTARYQLSKALFGSKLTGNSPVGPYLNHMIDLIEELEKLGCKLGKELSQNLILQSLSESFSQFVINFNMNKMDCDLHEMLNMLIDYENQLASEKKKGTVMLVGNSSKKKGKGKSKPKKKPTAPKGGVRRES